MTNSLAFSSLRDPEIVIRICHQELRQSISLLISLSIVCGELRTLSTEHRNARLIEPLPWMLEAIDFGEFGAKAIIGPGPVALEEISEFSVISAILSFESNLANIHQRKVEPTRAP